MRVRASEGWITPAPCSWQPDHQAGEAVGRYRRVTAGTDTCRLRERPLDVMGGAYRVGRGMADFLTVQRAVT